jgi:hypothetical protein
VEIDPGVSSGKRTHPSEEIMLVLEIRVMTLASEQVHESNTSASGRKCI